MRWFFGVLPWRLSSLREEVAELQRMVSTLYAYDDERRKEHVTRSKLASQEWRSRLDSLRNEYRAFFSAEIWNALDQNGTIYKQIAAQLEAEREDSDDLDEIRAAVRTLEHAVLDCVERISKLEKGKRPRRRR